MNNTKRSESFGHSDAAEADVVVVGGGLAGLTAAATVAAAGKRVLVREKLGVPGGDARSTNKDGFIFNQGPHALYRGGAAEKILTQLGVRISGGIPPVKGRIVMNGSAHVAPADPLTLMQTKAIPLVAKLQIAKVLALLPRQNPGAHQGTTVRQWVDKVVSHDAAANLLLGLVRLSTYVNQPNSLSADAAISQLQSALDQGVTYVDGGWQTLVDQLAATPGVEIRAGEPVTHLPNARAVIIAAGGPALASSLLDTTFQIGPAAQVSVVDLGLKRRPDHDVVIGGDVPLYFSNHSSVANLAPSGHFQAATMQYLADGDEPDHQAIDAFAAHAGVRDDDIMVSRRLHLMTAASTTPVAALGGLPGRPNVTDTGHDNVFIAGDWVGPVGLLADAAVSSGQAAATAALAKLGVR